VISETTTANPDNLTSVVQDIDQVIEQGSTFQPVMMLEAELSAPLESIPVRTSLKGQPYQSAQVMVRLHGAPLGVLDLSLTPAGLSAADYARTIWDALGAEINAHLDADHLPGVSALTADGLPDATPPQCQVERAAFLEHAPFVTVILCTRNRADKLDHCFEHLLALDYPR